MRVHSAWLRVMTQQASQVCKNSDRVTCLEQCNAYRTVVMATLCGLENESMVSEI